MRILHLPLKKKWLDMIASGEKKEEYREIKPYWLARLTEHPEYPKERPEDGKNNPDDIMYDLENGHDWREVFPAYWTRFRTYDSVRFTNGYGKNAPSVEVECLGIEISDTGFARWGFTDKCIVIKLGAIL